MNREEVARQYGYEDMGDGWWRKGKVYTKEEDNSVTVVDLRWWSEHVVADVRKRGEHMTHEEVARRIDWADVDSKYLPRYANLPAKLARHFAIRDAVVDLMRAEWTDHGYSEWLMLTLVQPYLWAAMQADPFPVSTKLPRGTSLYGLCVQLPVKVKWSARLWAWLRRQVFGVDPIHVQRQLETVLREMATRGAITNNDARVEALRNELKGMIMTQESQLQSILALLETVSTGVASIISRLAAIPPVSEDNPAIQDEIDAIRDVAQGMADEISSVLNATGGAAGGGTVPESGPSGDAGGGASDGGGDSQPDEAPAGDAGGGASDGGGVSQTDEPPATDDGSGEQTAGGIIHDPQAGNPQTPGTVEARDLAGEMEDVQAGEPARFPLVSPSSVGGEG